MIKNIKNIIITILLVITLLFGGLYFYRASKLGATPGTYHTNAETFADNVTLSGSANVIATTTFSGSIRGNSSSTLKCLQLYASSSVGTTYYVSIDTTTSSRGSTGGFLLSATTTKPSTICP